MVDPDAPEHLPGEYWIHWIISNIPVSFLQFYYYFDLI